MPSDCWKTDWPNMRNEISIRKCREEDKSAGQQCSLGLFVATFFRQN